MGTLRSKEELKEAFSTGKKPTQSDFSDIFDSYFHKNDTIDIASTSNIYSKNEVDEIVLAAVNGDENAAYLFATVNEIKTKADNAVSRSDAAYALAEHADGPGSAGYAWANSAHSRCETIEGNVQQLTNSVENAVIATNTAQKRADDAYTLAEHADGPESLGYTWANTAHTRCGVIEGNMQQLTNSVENAIITANTNASTSSYGRVQLASNTGTSSDSGKVPVLGSNGRLNTNILPDTVSTREVLPINFNYETTSSDSNTYSLIIRKDAIEFRRPFRIYGAFGILVSNGNTIEATTIDFISIKHSEDSSSVHWGGNTNINSTPVLTNQGNFLIQIQNTMPVAAGTLSAYGKICFEYL